MTLKSIDQLETVNRVCLKSFEPRKYLPPTPWRPHHWPPPCWPFSVLKYLQRLSPCFLHRHSRVSAASFVSLWRGGANSVEVRWGCADKSLPGVARQLMTGKHVHEPRQSNQKSQIPSVQGTRA